MMDGRYVPLDSYEEYPAQEMKQRAACFRAEMQRRRSVRDFSDRPQNERPFLVLVVGYPAEGVQVPDLAKKTLPEVVTFL